MEVQGRAHCRVMTDPARHGLPRHPSGRGGILVSRSCGQSLHRSLLRGTEVEQSGSELSECRVLRHELLPSIGDIW